MEALTLGTLTQLVRLHRAGVEGVADLLAELVGGRPNEVATVLDLPPGAIEGLPAHPRPIDLLVAAIEDAPRARRRDAARVHQEHARWWADELARTACVADAHVVLDVIHLGELLEHHRGPTLTFAGHGSVETARLRAIVRAVARLADVVVGVRGAAIEIVYRAAGVRGVIRLRLFVSDERDALTVRLPQLHPDEALPEDMSQAEAQRCPDVDAGGAEPTCDAPPPPAPLLYPAAAQERPTRAEALRRVIRALLGGDR
jgi:hypothetical protein